MKSARAFLLASLAPFAACHYARGVGYTTAMPEGRPAFRAGAPEGYWIWQDRLGWHLRATSAAPHRFHGLVESPDGSVSQVKAVGTSRGLSPGQDAIAFDWESSGGEHGFDWATSDGCARFDLYIDDDPRPLAVFLGGAKETPARMPFAVCR